jgi:hypothetical protein
MNSIGRHRQEIVWTRPAASVRLRTQPAILHYRASRRFCTGGDGAARPRLPSRSISAANPHRRREHHRFVASAAERRHDGSWPTGSWPAYRRRSCTKISSGVRRKVEANGFRRGTSGFPSQETSLGHGVGLTSNLVFTALFVTENQAVKHGTEKQNLAVGLLTPQPPQSKATENSFPHLRGSTPQPAPVILLRRMPGNSSRSFPPNCSPGKGKHQSAGYVAGLIES